MKSELAEELLATLMNWDRSAFQEKVRQLDALAAYKFDEYGNFRPGVRFFESLASWLAQFEHQNDRATALNFVLDRLIFISDAEMTHLIELVYPDHIDLVLRTLVASDLNAPSHEVSRIVNDPVFTGTRRRSLILGASDGARLDKLRRSAPFLSHEQFLQSCEPPVALIAPMRDKLTQALKQLNVEMPDTFAHVFLVDDFAGSGETLLRKEGDKFKGKLTKLRDAIKLLAQEGLVSDDITVTLILYVATEQAKEHLSQIICDSDLPSWAVRVVQVLPKTVRVDQSDTEFADLAIRMYDESTTDEHKGRAPLGYADCALPVVLSHNTPNNSVSLLWADTTQGTNTLQRRALFPRYERHHKDRP